MDKIFVSRCTPILCQEAISIANDLRIEVSGQLWPIISQTTYFQVTA